MTPNKLSLLNSKRNYWTPDSVSTCSGSLDFVLQCSSMIQTNYRISALRTTHSVQFLELLPSYYSTTLAEVDRSKLPYDRLEYQYAVHQVPGTIHLRFSDWTNFTFKRDGLVTMLYIQVLKRSTLKSVFRGLIKWFKELARYWSTSECRVLVLYDR